jgi:hypothetical protein
VRADPVELGRQMGALARRYPHMDVWGGCWLPELCGVAREPPRVLLG